MTRRVQTSVRGSPARVERILEEDDVVSVRPHDLVWPGSDVQEGHTVGVLATRSQRRIVAGDEVCPGAEGQRVGPRGSQVAPPVGVEVGLDEIVMDAGGDGAPLPGAGSVPARVLEPLQRVFDADDDVEEPVRVHVEDGGILVGEPLAVDAGALPGIGPGAARRGAVPIHPPLGADDYVIDTVPVDVGELLDRRAADRVGVDHDGGEWCVRRSRLGSKHHEQACQQAERE